MTIKTANIHYNEDHLGLLISNWGLQSLTADPATTYARIYYNSISGKIRLYDTTQTTWVNLESGGAGLDIEAVQDAVGAMIIAGNNIDATYNDTNGTLTIDVEALTSADLSDFTEAAQDAIGAMVTNTSTVNLTYTDGTPSLAADVNNSSITYAKIQNIATDRLLGRDTASSGVVEEITVGGGIEFTGSTSIQRSALTGDITATAGSNTTAIAAGVIVDADVNASAAIAATKLAFTPADTIAATTVQAAIVEALTDARAYADTINAGFDYKQSVRVATTGNITIATALNAGDTIDGITLANGDRVLVKDQSTGSENGIYVVAASPARSTDADVSAEVTGGLTVWVNEGTQNADTQWTLTTNDAITLDTTALVFTQTNALGQITAGNALTKTGNTLDVVPGTGLEISSDTIRIAAAAAGNGLTGGAGSALAVGAGNGITVNADDVALASSTAGAGLTFTTGVLAVGAGTGITVNTDDIAINPAVVVRKFSATIGDGSTADIVVNHALATRDVTVSVAEAGSPFGVQLVYWEATDTNNITIFFPTAPATNSLRVTVHA